MSKKCLYVGAIGRHSFINGCCSCGALQADTRCPVCGSDPCACDDDVELERGPVGGVNNAILGVEEEPINELPPTYYKHKPLPASALTSWPSVFDRMASAKLLNELKE